MLQSGKDSMCPICLEHVSLEIYTPMFPNLFNSPTYKVPETGLPAYSVQQNSATPGAAFIDILAPRCPLPGQDIWLTTAIGQPDFTYIVLYNRKGRTLQAVESDRAGDFKDLSGPFLFERTISTTCTGMVDGAGTELSTSDLGGCTALADRCAEYSDYCACPLTKHPDGTKCIQRDAYDPLKLTASELGIGRHTVRYSVWDASRFILPENRLQLNVSTEIIINVVPHVNQMPQGCFASAQNNDKPGYTKTCYFTTAATCQQAGLASAGTTPCTSSTPCTPKMCFTCGNDRGEQPFPAVTASSDAGCSSKQAQSHQSVGGSGHSGVVS